MSENLKDIRNVNQSLVVWTILWLEKEAKESRFYSPAFALKTEGMHTCSNTPSTISSRHTLDLPLAQTSAPYASHLVLYSADFPTDSAGISSSESAEFVAAECRRGNNDLYVPVCVRVDLPTDIHQLKLRQPPTTYQILHT